MKKFQSFCGTIKEFRINLQKHIPRDVFRCNLQHSFVSFSSFYCWLGLFSEDRSFHKSCAVNDDCNGKKQYCNTAIRLCECQPFFEYRFDTSNCSPCPLEGEECMGCCSNSNFRCLNHVCIRCDDSYYECE